MEHWADPRVLEDLRGSFARYDQDDRRPDLRAMLKNEDRSVR